MALNILIVVKGYKKGSAFDIKIDFMVGLIGDLFKRQVVVKTTPPLKYSNYGVGEVGVQLSSRVYNYRLYQISDETKAFRDNSDSKAKKIDDFSLRIDRKLFKFLCFLL